jgi:glycine cleavage system aminomethyltransferase T
MNGTVRPLARTPLHHWHIAHGASMAEREGWLVPAAYSNVNHEVAAAHTGVRVVDLSACGKIALKGSGVGTLAQALAPGSPALRPHGVGEFNAGGLVLASRLAEDHLLLLALRPNVTGLYDRLATLRHDVSAVQTDVSRAYAMFCLLPIAAEDLLSHLTAFDVRWSRFRPGTCGEASLAGVHAVLVQYASGGSCTMYVAVAWDLAEHIWESLLNASPGDIRPIGVDAWRLLSSEGINRGPGPATQAKL